MARISSTSHTLSGIALLFLVAGQLLPQVDFSIVNVSLESMRQTLNTNETGLVLIVALYGITFSLLLSLCGRLGDSFGRKKLFLIGIFIFALGSILCGMAHNLTIMLIGRVIQGIGAAALMPQILATIHTTLSGTAHAKAVGIYTSVGGVSFVIGQVFGGWLVSANIFDLGWRSVFYINIPICLIEIALGYFILPETTAEQKNAMDLRDMAIFALLLSVIMVPLSMAETWPWLWILLIATLPVAWWFWRFENTLEAKGKTPLLPPTEFRKKVVLLGFSAIMATPLAYSGYMFIVALVLQSVLHFTPAQSGSAFVALGVCFFLGARYSNILLRWLSNYQIVFLGTLMTLLGDAITWGLFAHYGDTLTGWDLLFPTAVTGLGNGFSVSSGMRITLQAVDKKYSGQISSAIATAQQACLALGAALSGAAYAIGVNLWTWETALAIGLIIVLVPLFIMSLFIWRVHPQISPAR